MGEEKRGTEGSLSREGQFPPGHALLRSDEKKQWRAYAHINTTPTSREQDRHVERDRARQTC